MNVLEIIDALKGELMWACLGVLLLIAAACAIVGLHRVSRVIYRLNPAALAAFVVAAIFATCEAQKRLLRDGWSGSPTLPSVTAEEIAQGWRLVAETNCEANVYAMPEGVSPSFNWHKRGTFGEWARLDLGGFAFPLGTNDETVTSFSVFNDGRIRPTPRDTAREICAVGVPMLAMQGASRFWVADAARPETAPYLSKLLTWENFFLNADTNVPVNAQIELFGNGDFATRSNDVERFYSRVAYFDWDGDGLENTVDPEPLTSGPDAHGTNAEWYNAVCSNVFEAVEGGASGTPRPTLSWRYGVNTNAYYFVDVVTTNGPAPIYFAGDRGSRLGNPVVVARASETNHVPLLIGVNYAVTSTVPFSVSLPDDGFVMITTNGVSNYEVCWPLNFVFIESIGESNRVYTVSVEPYDPGGDLTWLGTGGGMRSGVSPECDCGCLHCGGNSVWFSCSSICTCHGECQAVGNYAFEDALFAVTGGVCRCGFDDPPLESPAEHGDEPSLAITFSKQSVIFENAYEASRGVMKPKRSSRVRITVDAYGGDYGGVLSLTSANLGKLTPIGGGVTLPASLTLAADEYFHATGVYEGTAQSTEENDVSVSGTFTEHFTAQQHLSSNRLTVVKIEFKPSVTAPANNALGRHEYGVCELVEHSQEPSTPIVTWNPVGGGSNTVNTRGAPCYQFPLFACENPLRVELGDATYLPRLSCIEPSGIEVREVDLCTYGLSAGKAGGIGLLQAFYVKPFTVSFTEIAVEEVPSDRGEVDGYFCHALPSNLWSHTSSAGAGIWHDVFPGNRMGDPNFRDEAAITIELLPITPDGTLTNDYSFAWMWGTMMWEVPFGWNVKGTTNGTAQVKTFECTTQEFHIDPWGNVSVLKFGNQATRRLDDSRYRNGVRVFNNEVRNP